MFEKSTFVTSRSATALMVAILTATANYGIDIGIPLDLMILLFGVVGVFIVGNKTEDVIRNFKASSISIVKGFVKDEGKELAREVISAWLAELPEEVREVAEQIINPEKDKEN